MKRFLPLLAVAWGLTACSSLQDNASVWWSGLWGGRDNAAKPVALSPIQAEFEWSRSQELNLEGAGLGSFAPEISADSLVSVGANGRGWRIDNSGAQKIDFGQALFSGVSSAEGFLTAGTYKGEVLLAKAGGEVIWRQNIGTEVLTTPQIVGDVVVARATDGRVYGFERSSGVLRWQLDNRNPALVVRPLSGVAQRQGVLYIGQAGGKLQAIEASSGRLIWEAVVSQPKGANEVERMSDVVSTPVFDDDSVCAVAYQGRVACFELTRGVPRWVKDVSSYAGLAMDANHVYVSDEFSVVWAFDKQTGRNIWKQQGLYGRQVTAPAVWQDRVVVADYEGYLHALSPSDGHFVGRTATDGGPVRATPQVWRDEVWVQTSKGNLLALKRSR